MIITKIQPFYQNTSTQMQENPNTKHLIQKIHQNEEADKTKKMGVKNNVSIIVCIYMYLGKNREARL